MLFIALFRHFSRHLSFMFSQYFVSPYFFHSKLHRHHASSIRSHTSSLFQSKERKHRPSRTTRRVHINRYSV